MDFNEVGGGGMKYRDVDIGCEDEVDRIMEKFYIEKEKVYGKDEVAKHNFEGNMWIVIGGKVYDVSCFFSHPGGWDLIVENCGCDATRRFEMVGHSNEARNILNKFYIGEFDQDR